MTQVRNKTNHNGFNFLQSVCQGCILCVLFACLSATAQDSSAKNHQASKAPTVNADSSVAQSENEDSTAKSPAKPSLASLDEKLTLKGNDNPYPGFEEGMLGDMGGVRTALAKVGIGIIGTNSFIYERNVLDTPRHAPAKYDSTFYRGKAYIGEDDTYVNDANVAITYDMSRYKIPDGQLIVQFAKSDCNDGYYFVPTTKFMLNQLAWFQTLFNKKLDLKLGWINNNSDFIGSTVGGNFANTFGPGESIPVLIGMSLPPAPTVRFTWHVNDNVYEEFAVQRSLPVSGATGFPYYDEGIDNPYGIHFNSSISGTGELFINEFGYRQNPGPGRPSTWLRYTMMYNNSKFTDYSQLATGGTERGESAQSFLLDRQLWQQNPSSYATAYRGIYAGLTYQYAPSTTSPVTGYYEGRLYWIGPTPRRSSDLVQIVYGHNEKSKYLVDFSNKNNKGTDLIAQDRSNTYTTSYVAHLKRGIFASGGFSYTDRPSGTYFIGEGSSLNFLSSVYLVF